MNKYFLLFAAIGLTIIGCTSQNDPFSISEGRVGKFHKTDAIKDLYTIYANDSIVGDSIAISSGLIGSRISIFEKGGAPLLYLNPIQDSISVIGSVRVLDKRFKTDKGIGLESNFKAVSKTYTIDKIQTTFSSVIVSFKGLEVYVTIDRRELPEDLRYGPIETLDAIQIPEEAPIKNLMISWQR
jgi:hypothetical protein|tara:strand:+ start:1617 stop:2168 length:552 start_codon:yes stop_codon:yes gene_type:complete